MNDIVLETRDLCKAYRHTAVLDHVNIQIRRGQIVGFIGQNGAGKTTLLRMVAGLAFPTSGSLALWGQNDAKALESARKRIGCMIEGPALYGGMTARQNMEIQRLQRGLPDKALIDKTLALVGLADTGRKRVRNFSMGMRQRLGIALALLGTPEFLILDEPINGLDPAGIQEMRSLIASMPQTTGATVLISSHLLGEIEQMVDQVGILNHGKLLFEGSLQQLQKHSRGGILLRVLDAPKAAAVLQQQGVKAAAPADQPDTLQLPPLPDEALAGLVCTLAESGVGVVGLTAQTKSLEDIFLSLTQTSGEVA